MSPIYCDNRLTLSYPIIRKYIIDCFSTIIEKHFNNVEVIAGVATAGIPHAALLADKLNLPMVYVRSASKSHGKQNRIEGKLNTRKKIVLIEDLISTGKSSAEAALSLKHSGAEVLSICSIFSYDFPEAMNLSEKIKIPFVSLSDYNYLIEEAIESQYIEKSHEASLKNWRTDPSNWKPLSNG